MTGKADAAGFPLGVAGLLPGDERVYRIILRASGAYRLRLAELAGLSAEAIDEVLARLESAGLVQLSDGMVAAAPPAHVLGRIITTRTRQLRREYEQIDGLRNLIPSLVADHTSLSRDMGDAVDVRAVQDGDVLALVRRLATEGSGDLRWFRPDQWRLPTAPRLDALVRELIESGYESRAIYPATVLEEAPDKLRARAEAGERVRIVASVPTRMGIFGDSSVFMSDRWGLDTGRRLVVREHSLVGALRTLFDTVWEHAMAVPGLEGEGDDPAGGRRLLLQQLTSGAKDEQIARVLGVSLRTVRRRVADLMDELGAASRFQAGVEAVRRGWI
ncbi:MAG TPA: helix-turn-helix domain-containing protein [Nocardioidaceae bacterium]|nr:helix-turn-helix domain-containing protein [Nocardioidaceae bacterium]